MFLCFLLLLYFIFFSYIRQGSSSAVVMSWYDRPISQAGAADSPGQVEADNWRRERRTLEHWSWENVPDPNEALLEKKKTTLALRAAPRYGTRGAARFLRFLPCRQTKPCVCIRMDKFTKYGYNVWVSSPKACRHAGIRRPHRIRSAVDIVVCVSSRHLGTACLEPHASLRPMCLLRVVAM